MTQSSNVTPLRVPALRRAAAKLYPIQSNHASFDALVDALIDLHPRRTIPPAFDAVVTPTGHVMLVSMDEDVTDCGNVEKVRSNLKALGAIAKLEPDEIDAVMLTIEEARIPED